MGQLGNSILNSTSREYTWYSFYRSIVVFATTEELMPLLPIELCLNVSHACIDIRKFTGESRMWSF